MNLLQQLKELDEKALIYSTEAAKEVAAALPAVVTLVEAAHRHIEDEAADAIAVRALETDENVTAAQQHQRGTRQRANESFGVLCAALAPFVGEATQ